MAKPKQEKAMARKRREQKEEKVFGPKHRYKCQNERTSKRKKAVIKKPKLSVIPAAVTSPAPAVITPSDDEFLLGLYQQLGALQEGTFDALRSGTVEAWNVSYKSIEQQLEGFDASVKSASIQQFKADVMAQLKVTMDKAKQDEAAWDPDL